MYMVHLEDNTQEGPIDGDYQKALNYANQVLLENPTGRVFILAVVEQLELKPVSTKIAEISAPKKLDENDHEYINVSLLPESLLGNKENNKPKKMTAGEIVKQQRELEANKNKKLVIPDVINSIDDIPEELFKKYKSIVKEAVIEILKANDKDTLNDLAKKYKSCENNPLYSKVLTLQLDKILAATAEENEIEDLVVQPDQEPAQELVVSDIVQNEPTIENNPGSDLTAQDGINEISLCKTLTELFLINNEYKHFYCEDDDYTSAYDEKKMELSESLFKEYVSEIEVLISPSEVEALSNSDKYSILEDTVLEGNFKEKTQTIIHQLKVYAAVCELKTAGSKIHLEQIAKKYTAEITDETSFKETYEIMVEKHTLKSNDPNFKSLEQIMETVPSEHKDTAIKVWSTFKNSDSKMLVQMKEHWKSARPDVAEQPFVLDLYEKRRNELRKAIPEETTNP